MSYIIVFTIYHHGWYSRYDDMDMCAYKSLSGWTLVYSYNTTPTYKARLFASDSVYGIMFKVKELTGKEMRFAVVD